MANQYFEFKQFRIEQEKAAMKVGTDGVLLGAWVDLDKANSILDVGTGTGLIAIMLAQRTFGKVRIDAVEIDLAAYQQAVDNFNNCSWSSHIEAKHIDFQNFCKNDHEKYDLIISNPPYFRNGLNSKDSSRTKARNADHLPLDELILGAKRLLNSSGILAVILPVDEACLFEKLAGVDGFYLKRKFAVLPNPGKSAKRILLEFCLTNVELVFSEIIVENGQRHVYSPEYRSLTKDFYLNF
ncbi:tRNA1(Val) (adenine(37)-N6)-methyltransferase [Ancylomarina longa]|uniref:tRNA1(Val) (adenine(37)-N6)-methyltransferase n=1 Tax=Ancylomarina longa TaxID=2487017 RepID=A0A434AGB1_9BACT|nr:methyltransferase [Ancylomarina longa]RUT73412.1 methyltransferase domain-containing protein [Ancylomarina longa]